MRIDLLDYTLPPELIAQTPPEQRDGGRLLLVDPTAIDAVELVDEQVETLDRHIPPGALLVVNDTRVIPARLIAKKPETGGRVEIFLVRPEGPGFYETAGAGPDDEPVRVEGEVWRALGKASKPLRFDQSLEVGEDLVARILGRAEDDGLLRVLLVSPRPILDAVEEYGHVPLPPYIKRADEADDHERYQTVFARTPGAVAAPTAGLHITQAMLGRLSLAGVELASVTLHVGLGTFQPVTAADLDEHPMHEEHFSVSRATANAIIRAKREGRPVIAVGTTAVRAVESAAAEAVAQGSNDVVVPCSGPTKLLLQPGVPIRAIDGLLTNFHLPKSTLMALVAAFIGVPNLLAAYRHAVAARYRFFSYGDAMLIRRKLPTSAALESVAVASARAEAAQ